MCLLRVAGEDETQSRDCGAIVSIHLISSLFPLFHANPAGAILGYSEPPAIPSLPPAADGALSAETSRPSPGGVPAGEGGSAAAFSPAPGGASGLVTEDVAAYVAASARGPGGGGGGTETEGVLGGVARVPAAAESWRVVTRRVSSESSPGAGS